MSKFKLPVSEYYSKSSTLQQNLQMVLDDFENDFLNKIKDADLDGKDLAKVQSLSSYMAAKEKHQSLKDEELLKLEHMSSEGGANPINPLLEKDREFKGKFSDIQNGNNKAALSKHMGSVNTAITIKRNQQGLIAIIQQLQGVVDSDTYKRLMLLTDRNPIEAVTLLLNSDSVMKMLSQNSAASNALFKVMENMDEMGRFIDGKGLKMGLEKLLNSDGFNRFFNKCSGKTQEKLLNGLAKIEKASNISLLDLINKDSKFVKTLGHLVTSDKAGIIEDALQFGKAKIGKWGKFLGGSAGILVDKGITFFSSFAAGVSGEDGSIGKGVVEDVIDTVASIGPAEGAILGAQIGGGFGALIGGFAGTINFVGQLLFPNAVDDIKNSKITKSIEKGINNCGKAVKTGIDTASTWMRKTGEQLKETAENLINPPKLSLPDWF